MTENSSNNNQLEELELQFEDHLNKAPMEMLLKFAEGSQITDMSQVTRKSAAMRKIRDHISDLVAHMESDAEKIEFFEKIHKVFDELKAETTTEAAATDEASKKPEDKVKLRPVQMKDEDRTGSKANDVLHMLKNMSTSAQSDNAWFKRPLKISGIVASPDKSNSKSISYINLSAQIADAKNSYTDEEICREIRKSVATNSPLKTYFDTQVNMGLTKMMEMLRNFYKEKSAAELFQELSSLKQNQSENATDFLLRGFEVRQRLMAAAEAEGECYEEALVTSTFHRAVRTGLKNGQVRAHMRPFLLAGKKPTEDDQLLSEINLAEGEYEEITSKMKTSTKKITVNEVKTETTKTESKLEESIKPLMESLSQLQKQVQELQERRQKYSGGRKLRLCENCQKQKNNFCKHCFKCGEAGHVVSGCPKNC